MPTPDDRIKIEVDNLTFVLCNNSILCKVDVVTGMGRDGLWTGNELWDNTAGLCTRFGEVVKLPKALTFRKNSSESGMEWQTEMEAKIGDIAYWGIMEGTNCPVIKCGDDVFFLVDYGEVRLIKRGEEIIPVNGFILLEEVVANVKSSLITPDSAKKTNKRKGVVKYLGKRNKCYYPETELVDPVDIKVGDVVLFKKDLLTVLEDSRYFSLQKGIFYCQGRWVISKI